MSGVPFDIPQFFSAPNAPEDTQLDRFLRQGKSGFEAEAGQVHFHATQIPDAPETLQTYLDYLHQEVVNHSVRLGDPRFIGHMTSALPNFLAPLSRIVNTLNQNVVKLETSGAFTAFERQALGLLHRLVFARDDAFYAEHTQDPESTLGMMVSGGTLGNVAALWCARNRCFGPTGDFAGVEQEGFAAALQAYGARRALVIGSSLMHYSLRKAVGLLGLGERNLLGLTPTRQGCLNPDQLRKVIIERRTAGDMVMAIVGIAGTTETGAVDPLNELAELAAELNIHLHIDAAWGGPTLFSDKHAYLLAGIERAHSVVIDGHKQLWLPMGTGMVICKDPSLAKGIEKTANYIIRSDSGDLGRRSLEGSRPATAVYLHAALHLLGRQGYGTLIDGGIARAVFMAELIQAHPAFELVSAPVLNILTYRYIPSELRAHRGVFSGQEQARINAFTVRLQMRQRDAGNSFVSRTRLFHTQAGESIEVLRAVLANPLTSEADIQAVLGEQAQLGDQLEQEAAGLFDLFAERVLCSPQTVALYEHGQAINYARLAEKVTRVTLQLRRAQIAPGTIIGLAAERSEAYMAGMLAIIQVGACFMPLDPGYPAERLRYMLADSQTPLILVDTFGATALQQFNARCVRIDQWLSDSSACAIDLAAVKRSADDALYVMYTSGSTGDAKGVVGLQGATLNRLEWMWRQFPFAADEIACQKTSPSFVDSIWEMLGPLLAGVPSVIINSGALTEPNALVETLADHRVTRIVLLPSLLKTLLSQLPNLAERLPALWLWTVSGEALPRQLAVEFRAQLPQACLLNVYGSTEVAADVTYWPFTPTAALPDSATAPIGFPIANVQVHLLGSDAQPVAEGCEGEIYVSGAALAAGYLHRPELTDERFVSLPAVAAGRLYRTGDRARRLADQALVFTGRVDDQVKIAGVRVEPTEVARALLELPDVLDATVLASASANSAELQLIAFLVVRPAAVMTQASVQKALACALVPAALPSIYVFLPELPRTPTGKVARSELLKSI
ncbi:MAG TPA: amino acid adenylation domain-containing protein [Cellvibrionaceae bacterium]